MTRKKEVIPVPATEVASKAVRLDLSLDQHAELRVEAAKLGKPMAVVVRDLVVAFLAERASLHQGLRAEAIRNLGRRKKGGKP